MTRQRSEASLGIEPPSIDLACRVTAAWPAEQWCDVHVLAAVSGGADSMALLRALVEAKRRAGGAGKVLAAHVNHGLRGAAADGDEAWLVAQCQALGVPLEVRRGDAAAVAAAQGDGLEAAARAERYRLLADMAGAGGARFVVTAHTRDDQVETVLFRLLRGTGMRGLAGMRATRELSPGVSLVRPLLGVTRQEVAAYLTSLGQSWREDHTNDDLRFARNRLRRELLPYLREHFNADADEAIARVATLAGEAQEVVERLGGHLLEQAEAPAERGRVSLKLAVLAGQPEAVVREALRQAWRRAGFSEQSMTSRWWRRLTGLALAPDEVETLNLPGSVLATRAGDWLVLARPQLP